MFIHSNVCILSNAVSVSRLSVSLVTLLNSLSKHCSPYFLKNITSKTFNFAKHRSMYEINASTPDVNHLDSPCTYKLQNKTCGNTCYFPVFLFFWLHLLTLTWRV